MVRMLAAGCVLTRRVAIETHTEERLSVIVLRWALVLLTAIFGALSIATHGARFLRLTFREYSVISCILALTVLAAWVWAWGRERRQIGRMDRGVLLLVLAAGVAGAAMASVYRLPDMDDFAYVPDAVHFQTYPDERMGYTVHYGYFEGKPQFTIIESSGQRRGRSHAVPGRLSGGLPNFDRRFGFPPLGLRGDTALNAEDLRRAIEDPERPCAPTFRFPEDPR